MSKQKIHPAKSLHGGIEPPGDKSISHRYAMLAALAEGTSELRHFSTAADCHSTLECMKALGADVRVEKDDIRITGRGLHESKRALDAGNSGTTMRLLTGILAGQPFASKLTGDASLQKRPMKRVVGPLRQMGAQISARDDNFAPLEVRGGRLKAIEYEMPMASAQVKSAVLLAGLFADGATTVIEAARTRDHTELALEEFGAQIERHGRSITVHGLATGNGASPGASLQGRTLDIPGDLSSAVFFIAAASLFPESTLLIHNVGLNPTRTAILDVFLDMGAAITTPQLHTSHGEVVGDVAVKGTTLKGGVVEGSVIPLVIDELPMLAALGPYTEEGIEIRNAEELRVKESDRIAALAENLRRMGAQVEERPDGLKVAGKRVTPKLRAAEIDPRGDHRIAMAFAVAALAAEGPTTIRDSDCAAVSFPTFYSELDRLAAR
jgi:3-phosphoshikimate 1-carboxyvinyltransferase